jgi:D-3-phosphoglycerate dehydrogenase / 2-oxoglutarate reductase
MAIVVYSRRLGALTETERRIGTVAELREAPLFSAGEIVEHGRDANVLLVGAVEPLTAAVLRRLPDCVGVVRRGIGHDNVDVEAATKLGIVVANVPDASVQEVSDHALALCLALARRVVPLDRAVHAQHADPATGPDPGRVQATRRGMRRLDQQTLGVVGFGRIGAALAGKARHLFARVLVSDPAVPAASIAAAGALPAGLDELLASADIVSLNAPLVPATHHLIGERALARMRPGALLVNTARGGLVDHDALARALDQGRLAGAGLDVTDPEPLPAGHPLLRGDAVVLTGHSAASSETATAELRRRSVDAVLAILAGRHPDSVVNPEVLDRPGLRMRRRPSENPLNEEIR